MNSRRRYRPEVPSECPSGFKVKPSYQTSETVQLRQRFHTGRAVSWVKPSYRFIQHLGLVVVMPVLSVLISLSVLAIGLLGRVVGDVCVRVGVRVDFGVRA